MDNLYYLRQIFGVVNNIEQRLQKIEKQLEDEI